MQAIVAVSKNWGIGREGQLLFSIPEDMKFFRTTTTGKTVIMGRKTLESMPGGKPLKNRRNIIISTREGYEVDGAETVLSPMEAMKLVEGTPEEDIFVIGGGEVYRAMLPFCSRALVTHVEAKPEADKFFPNLDTEENWMLEERGEEKEHEGLKFCFCTYSRCDLNRKPRCF